MCKKRIIAIKFIFIFLITGVSLAQNNNSIDQYLEDCVNKKSSTEGMVECGEEVYRKWDAELNKYYKLLLGILKKEPRKWLKESQLAWGKFRDSEFRFIENGYFQDFGSYIRPTKISNKIDIVKARVLELKIYYETIKDGTINKK